MKTTDELIKVLENSDNLETYLENNKDIPYSNPESKGISAKRGYSRLRDSCVIPFWCAARIIAVSVGSPICCCSLP